jgi:hypothetical protein
MKLVLAFIILIVSCSPSYRSIGLYNSSEREIIIETKPNIRYTGGPEKYIGIEKDSSGRGQVWKFGEINSIVVYPDAPHPKWDSTGVYIMKPKSGLQIGFLPHRKELTYDNLQINSIKIITVKDTIVANSRLDIWNLLNYNKSKKKIQWVKHDKAIIID